MSEIASSPRLAAALTATWLGPAVVVLVGFYLMLSTWGAGPDPILDFGRELYLPWRIVEGDVLYRDIRHFNGPLSAYLHAAVMALFGVALISVTTFNAMLLAGLTALLYWLMARLSDRLTAAAGSVTFLVLFGLAHRTRIANFNFITPYSYELTHGLMLSVAMIAALYEYAHRRQRGWLITAGVLLGLVFLTKAEVFFAAAVAGLAGLVLMHRPWRELGRAAAIFIGSALVAPLIALVLLSLAMPPAQAMRGIAGAWNYLGREQLAQLPYYRALAGTDDIAASLSSIAKWTAAYAAVLVPAVGLALWLRPGRRARIIALIAAGVTFAGLWLLGPGTRQASPGLIGPVPPAVQQAWEGFARPLSLLMPLVGVAIIVLVIRRREALPGRWIGGAVFATFAAAMLARSALNVTVVHYGFALTMAAMLAAVMALLGWLPAWLDRRGGAGIILRGVMLGALGFIILLHGRITHDNIAPKTFAVASGGDFFLADGRGVVVDVVVDDLKARTSPTATLATLPDGEIINYLARRVNPTGHLKAPPPELIMYGEANVLADFQRNPPDYIVLVHRDNIEYGRRFFGRDYAREIAAWIEQHYHRVQLYGQEPFIEGNFGLLLLQRNP